MSGGSLRGQSEESEPSIPVSARLVPRFLGAEGERHFTLQFRPESIPRGHVLYLPPFAEEMNRCRALAAAQARHFAARGFSCTLLDFYGTGDSQGELAEATLARWHSNIALTVQRLQDESPAPVILWGCRLGALLAMHFAATGGNPIAHLLLWQPVTSGKRYMNQLLRHRVAALVNSGAAPETTADIRQRLQAGAQIEVAGYFLGNTLFTDLEGLDLKGMAALCSGEVHWLERLEEEGEELPTATARALATLREQGNTVSLHNFRSPPVWQLHKRADAPELLATTTRLLDAL